MIPKVSPTLPPCRPRRCPGKKKVLTRQSHSKQGRELIGFSAKVGRRKGKKTDTQPVPSPLLKDRGGERRKMIVRTYLPLLRFPACLLPGGGSFPGYTLETRKPRTWGDDIHRALREWRMGDDRRETCREAGKLAAWLHGCIFRMKRGWREGRREKRNGGGERQTDRQVGG